MKHLIVLCWFIVQSLPLRAQQITYYISAPDAAHHVAQVKMEVQGLPAGDATFRMSRSSPGRYATHEFGKNVYRVSATDATGRALNLQRTAGDVYVVKEHNGTVHITYTLFANHADGTYADIDTKYFHLNMPAVFMWVKGLEQAPMRLHILPADTSWQVATQLFPTNNKFVFTAPNLQYFMDAPTLAANIRFKEWKEGDQTIRIAYHTLANDNALNEMTGEVKKLVTAAKNVFGELPQFENRRYTFLAALNPWAKGDGMEHRNSTMISSAISGDNIMQSFGTFSHEFFHAWNIERIRPGDLEPFNFEQSNISTGLWFGEGFTQYYGMLLEARIGLTNPDGWRQMMANLINTKRNTPGGSAYSVVSNSQDAVFVDAGISVDKSNWSTHHSSYYITGAATALALELELQSGFNKTLDDYMKMLWQTHGKVEKPYTINDLQQVLAKVTGNATHAAQFFEDYIYGIKAYPYAEKLATMGLQLEPVNAKAGWVGNAGMSVENGNLVLKSTPMAGTPLYEAGLGASDAIISVNGVKPASIADWDKMITDARVGSTLQLVYSQKGEEKASELVVTANPAYKVTPLSNASAAAKERFKNWLKL